MRTTTIAILVTLAFGFVACGEDDQGNGNESDLEVAVRAYTASFAEGDPDAAWQMVSSKCQEVFQERESEYRATVAAAGELLESLEVLAFDATVGDDRAFVDVEMSDPDFDRQGQRWALEGGEWRWDDC